MLSQHILKAGLYFIGVAAVLIGGAIAVIGIEMVGRFFSALINVVYEAGPLAELGHPNNDSELRFYSVFFAGYGGLLVQTARDLSKHGGRLNWLLGLFFLGGVARLLSYLMIGPPHALFMLLMFIELIMPPILYALWRHIRLRSQPIILI